MLPDSAVNKPLIAIITENSPKCLTVLLLKKEKKSAAKAETEGKKETGNLHLL